MYLIDETASFARRDADAVRLVLTVTGEADLSDSGLRLTRGKRRVRASATADLRNGSWLVESRVPAARLKPGVWRLSVRADPDAKWQLVAARLLVGGEQPIALLPGPARRGGADDLLRGSPAPRSRARRVAARGVRVIGRLRSPSSGGTGK